MFFGSGFQALQDDQVKALSELASELPVPQSQGQLAPPKLPVSLPLLPRQNPQTPGKISCKILKLRYHQNDNPRRGP
jgi:hypothetical protein